MHEKPPHKAVFSKMKKADENVLDLDYGLQFEHPVGRRTAQVRQMVQGLLGSAGTSFTPQPNTDSE